MTGLVCSCQMTDERKRHQAIQQMLKAEKRHYEDTIRILVCGTGDSGKTTLIKQMKILHLGGFNDEERRQFMPSIIVNVLGPCLMLLEKSLDEGVTFDKMTSVDRNEINTLIITMTMALSRLNYDFPAVTNAIVTEMVASENFLPYLNKYKTPFHIQDGIYHFLENLNKMYEKGYVPTDQDILHTKILTQGIYELSFEVNKIPFLMYDIGGQKIYRKKWCTLYDQVSCIIFVIAISEYDHLLAEDENINRLHDSIEQFKEIRKDDRLSGKPFVLFLNKVDIFNQKISRIPLSTCFPDCPADIVYDEFKAREYILEKILEGDPDRESILIRYTCATDTDNVKLVFEAARQHCLSKGLELSGIA